jgi:hypothetical protein
VDFGHFNRLEESRRNLREQQHALENSTEAGLAERLRPALSTAIETLRRLYNDDAVWDEGRRAVTAIQGSNLAQVREDYARTLPPLLSLFGYESPPPPSAEQLVNDTVFLLNGIIDGDASAEEVQEARQQLGVLLNEADDLPQEPPWKVIQSATKVNSWIQLGLEVALGSGLGAVGGAFVGAAAGAITGGIAPVAGFVVLGGVRRFRELRAVEHDTEEFLAVHAALVAQVFPATGAAAVQHLNQVLALSAEHGGNNDPSAPVQVTAHLDALIDISKRFVLWDPQRIAVIRQAQLREHNNFPRQLSPLLCQVHEVADKARTEKSLHGSIPMPLLPELKALRDRLLESLPLA